GGYQFKVQVDPNGVASFAAAGARSLFYFRLADESDHGRSAGREAAAHRAGHEQLATLRPRQWRTARVEKCQRIRDLSRRNYSAQSYASIRRADRILQDRRRRDPLREWSCRGG